MNPISGIPLSATHSSEIAVIWSVIDRGALGKLTHSAVIPDFLALFRAVRTSWNRLPVNAICPRSSTVSSATWIPLHPRRP